MSGKKVLIVDDQPHIRMLLKRYLSEYEVEEAENGKQALVLLGVEKDQIAAILLDISMPHMDGFDVLNYLKENEIDIPVCMITSSGQESFVRKALRLGADDYIVKPTDKELLEQKLKLLINGVSGNAFARIRSDLIARILLPNSYIPIRVKSFTELEIEISSPLELPLGAKVMVDSPWLKENLDIEHHFFIKVNQLERDGSEFRGVGSFVGLNEIQQKKLRRIALRGGDLHGKKEDD